MDIFKLIILVIPILLTTGLSFLNFLVFLKNYFREEEVTLIHIALVFFFATMLFSLLLILTFVPTSSILFYISIANVVTWILFLEVANAYFSAFINRTKAIERYIPTIFGAAIGISFLGSVNPKKYLFEDPLKIESIFYLIAILALLYVFIMSFRRVSEALDFFEGEELKLLLLTRQIFFLGACCMIYTSVSFVTWLIVRDITNFSFDILNWQLIDWIVFFNVPLYFGILLGALIRTLKLNFNEIDIPTILNIIDSPRDG